MHSETVLSPEELRSVWRELANDEELVDPYELTEHGELVMSPRPTNRHQIARGMVAKQLTEQLGGLAIQEAAVITATAGVRVPDVVWMAAERWTRFTSPGADLVESPDLVVGVLSPGNRKAEVAHKVQAYLVSGAREVIIVTLDGAVQFHRADGAHPDSVFGVAISLPRELFA